MEQYDKIIGMNIMRLRKQNKWTQEQLADKTGVTFQAVSKWENGLSCPDVNLLPGLAQLFGVSIDALFGEVMGRKENTSSYTNLSWRDDDKLRVVVYKGHELLQESSVDEKIIFEYRGEAINIESRLSVQCNDVGGNISAGAAVNCGSVGGYIEAEGQVNCGSVAGYIEAEGGVNCGAVAGCVEAGSVVNCGDVAGNVNAGGDIQCGDIEGNVSSGGSISCGDVEGDVNAGGDVQCKDIEGNVEAQKSVTADEIHGNVRSPKVS